MKRLTAIVIVIGIAVAVPVAAIPLGLYSFNSVGPSHIISSQDVLLAEGSILNITNKMHQINSGFPGGGSYYAGNLNFTVSSYMTITGSWSATSNSTLWISKANQVWMELPVPSQLKGGLNMSLAPGSYSLTYGGYPGDSITIKTSVQLTPLTVKSISSLNIPAGTVISSSGTGKQYFFNITQNGTIVGSFSVSGPYSFSVYSKAGPGFAFSTLKDGNYRTGNLSTALVPGQYTVTFSGGTFTITSTMKVLNINQY